MARDEFCRRLTLNDDLERSKEKTEKAGKFLL